MELLALDRVEKRFRRGRREVVALDGVSLELFAGDYLGVMGETRSGKTTLLRVAAGMERPDAGTVRFRGRELGDMSRREREAMLRFDIGCVWQGDRSYRRLPVVSHVAFPLVSAGLSRAKAIARAHDFLRRVSVEHCADGLLPELSASEFARVSFAQALIREPRLLLADEPTDTLDMVERDEILGIVRSAASDVGVAVLMTAGDATGLTRANRFASLSEGRLLLQSSEKRGSVTVFPRASRRGDASG